MSNANFDQQMHRVRSIEAQLVVFPYYLFIMLLICLVYVFINLPIIMLFISLFILFAIYYNKQTTYI